MRWIRRFARAPILIITVALCAVLLATTAWAVGPHLSRTLDSVERGRTEVELGLLPGALRTKVYAADGSQIGVLRYDVDRELVELGDVDPDVIATLLATEDEKFWVHNGVDLRATVRALVSNVSSGGISSGGSTITQQIVKLRVVGNERSFNRKIKEAVLATRLEEEYSKTQILEFYINEIYLGNGAYGIQAGAETYFGKNASELDVGEMAFLAGLIRSPGVFDGFNKNVEVVARRRSGALAQAEEAGIITATERAMFDSRPIPSENLSPQRTDNTLRPDYFLDEVTTALLNLPALGETNEQRFNLVFNGGLRIETTLRPELEAEMKAAIAEEIPEKIENFEVAMATIDPATGAVLAFIGGPDFLDLQFNLATQGKRQPGSSFKPYVLATAIEHAAHLPHDTISGLGPCTFPNPPQPDYTVHNFDNSDGRIASITSQTLASSNCAFVRLGLKTGLERVAETATRFFGRSVEDAFEAFPSLSLGAQEVTVLEQASGYSTFINGGIRMEPYYITRVIDKNGELLYEHVPRGSQVISKETSDWVSVTLEANVRAGTGTRAQLSNGHIAAGKTGTSQDFTDAWFVGYTPQYATAVWMGDPTEKIAMRDVQGRNGTGGWLPARIWGNYMNRALQDEPARDLPNSPPIDRASQYLFLSGDICSVNIYDQDDELLGVFEVNCSMAQIDSNSGELTPLPEAICIVNVNTGYGVTRQERLSCLEITSEYLFGKPTQDAEGEGEDGEEGEDGSGEDGSGENGSGENGEANGAG